MKRLALKVDSKGRIQVPKELREELRIGKEVSVRIEGGTMTIEPFERIFDRLANEVTFNFKSVATELPNLRKAAEEEMLKHAS
jgi:AbrB family looped-hinge helix DNA binding protein